MKRLKTQLHSPWLNYIFVEKLLVKKKNTALTVSIMFSIHSVRNLFTPHASDVVRILFLQHIV